MDDGNLGRTRRNEQLLRIQSLKQATEYISNSIQLMKFDSYQVWNQDWQTGDVQGKISSKRIGARTG